jgi:hypothetical protein
MSSSVEVLGLKEALRELNTIDRSLRLQINRDFRRIVQPVIKEAKTMLPSGAPLSGMARPWAGKSGADIMSWLDDRVKKNMSAFTNARRVQQLPTGNKRNLGVFGVKWKSPQATIFDMGREGVLGQNLTNRFGPPSRVLYKAYASAGANVELQVQQLVNKVMKQTNNDMRLR